MDKYEDLLDGPVAFQDLLLARLAAPQMHQVWKEKLDRNSDVLIVWHFSNESHAIGFFETHSDFSHHCFDFEQPVGNGVYDVFTFQDNVKTRVVCDDLPVDLSLQLEPE